TSSTVLQSSAFFISTVQFYSRLSEKKLSRFLFSKIGFFQTGKMGMRPNTSAIKCCFEIGLGD
ncbi:hypothetical protein, partial [Desulfobacter curvatus]|uniref:hypothetical protein n=1 Tax=Desulfobacter curvatus TaxID=2290 RepID=UPI001B7FEB1D